MAVMKEWVCMAHGDFDSTDERCPQGCEGAGMIQRVFRTAPPMQSAGYRSINRSFETLAAQHRLTDMRTTRTGEAHTRVTYDQRRRTARDMEMLGHHGENAGQDMSTYFKPLAAMGQIGAQPGALTRNPETGRVIATDGMGGQVAEFSKPTVVVAGRHDGASAGLPAGDA